jgi:lactoylglutathione lyase
MLKKKERFLNMNFKFAHNNYNVFDLEKSVEFYKEALGLEVIRRKEAEDGSFILVFMGDNKSNHQLELTWLRDWDRAYNLGDNEIHLAFIVDDYEKAYEKHKEMECVCFENPSMGIYFIADPDGYWIEIIPER